MPYQHQWCSNLKLNKAHEDLCSRIRLKISLYIQSLSMNSEWQSGDMSKVKSTEMSRKSCLSNNKSRLFVLFMSLSKAAEHSSEEVSSLEYNYDLTVMHIETSWCQLSCHFPWTCLDLFFYHYFIFLHIYLFHFVPVFACIAPRKKRTTDISPLSFSLMRRRAQNGIDMLSSWLLSHRPG